MRLGKFLAHAGVASRRGSEEVIFAGRVTVNGKLCVDPATGVDSSDSIRVDGQELGGRESRVVYMINKPLGVVSTASDPQGRRTVVDLVPGMGRLYPVGRLDVNSSGLLLLTNDGDLANILTHPRYGVPKAYRARIGGGSVGADALRLLSEGVMLDDGITLPARVSKLGPGVIEIEIREGRNHQVRRMCEVVGHPVLALERVAIGPLQLGRLKPGGHRRLHAGEIEELRATAVRD
ncbi:MAG: pseudouridine synthase [Solirubrobacterales bacterium]|nr:pseudouridine synthase [Solirubrobacterales bacterium]